MIVKNLIILLVLLSTVISDQPPKTQKTQIVDANHYYSEQNKNKVYNIDHLEKDKTLAVVLKPIANQPYNNTITLVLTTGSSKKQCKMRSYDDLCILQSVTSTQGSMEIKCENLPCQLQWRLYQPVINKLQSTEKVENLYQLPKDSDRLIISLYCKSVVDKQNNQRVSIARSFSNLPFSRLQMAKQFIFLIFEEVKQGFLYLLVDQKYKNCAKMTTSASPKTIKQNQLYQDFVRKEKKNIYGLQDIPENKDFRFDISFHTPGSRLEKHAKIFITGVKSGERKTIRQNIVQFSKTFKNYDLSYAVPKINTSQWKQIQLQIQIFSQNPAFVDIKLSKSEKIQVQATEFSYFDLKKGQKLSYLLIPQDKAQEKDQIKINLSNQQKIKSSLASCKVKPGCSFQIQALDDVKAHVFLGVGKGFVKQALVFDFGESWTFTKKIKQLESVYIKKKLQIKKPVQVTINSPNVIVYASNSKKCQYPSELCYQKLGNIHRHFIYYPQTQEQTLVYFLIKALDACQFTLALIKQDTQFIELVDSQPFVYLFDKQQKSLTFRFIRKQKVDISFNLIASVGALDLIAENGKKIPEDQQAQISSEGFLLFKASQSPKDTFTVLVRKREPYNDKFVHFTLIASSKGKMIRLESGITHYQTLQQNSKNKGKVQYIFQFNPSQKFILNFYSHNNKEEKMEILLTLTALTSNTTQKKQVSDIYIDKPSDVLDLSDFSEKLCAAVDDEANCEISLSLSNKMDRQIDIAITLMSHHTILQLKDGIWQSFSLNTIAKSSHFYFFPRNKNDDVALMFKTTDPAIRLKYRLFYSSNQQIDMSQWPFPSQQLTKQDQQLHKSIRPVNHFNIGKNSLNQCWPNCVVLISIIDLLHKQTQGAYSLMASNSIMQIPEKQKVDIVLKAEQTKAYLIDLKYALSIEQNIYFYVYHSLGLTNIWMNVYSEKNDRIPDGDQFDFSLNSQKQIIIPLQQIKDIMKKQQMQDHNNIYLFIVVQAISDAKLSIQFTFKEQDEQNYKLLGIDSFEHVNISPKSKKIYYLSSDQNYQIKIARQSGFPFYSEKICKNDLEKCLQEFKQENDQKKTQILTKVAAYTSRPCEGCFYAFKITTQQDPSQLIIHAQSGISEIQLTQNKPVYDFTEKNEQNRYSFYAIRGQEIYVNIHVSQGQIQVQLTDLNKIKQKRTGKNIISLIIPKQNTMTQRQKFQSKKLTKQQKQALKQQQKNFQSITILRNQNLELAQSLMSAFGLSDRFIEVHIRIKSTSQDKPSIYTITYSSGQRQFQLQDGLITSYMLEPNKQALFYYSTPSPSHIYFTVSMQKANYLKDLQISIKYCEPKDGIIDDDCWVEISSGSPTIKDKVPHPTMMYLLPNKNNLGISMKYKGDHGQKVNLGINHQQIMILPFQNEYPFVLHSNQSIHFIVQLSNNGYIQIITRKCDQSNPIFSYTFDYQAFQKEQFTYQAQLGSNPKSRFISKVKPGTLYMQMKTIPNQQSMVSIYVRYSEKKIFDPEVVPGNKGNVEYSIIDSSNAQLKISPPSCPDSHCPSNYKYYLMVSTNMRDLYSQLVCPSNFFTNSQFSHSQQIKLNQVTPKKNSDGTLSIQFKLVDQISYVGVKVLSKDKQIYYKPVQVATLWGQLSRTSHSHKLTIGVVFILSILSITICVRRNARKGYRQIQDQI